MHNSFLDGDPLVTEQDVCAPSDIVQAVRGFLLGDITLAQLEGVTASELYSIADLGYDFLEEGRPDVARRLFAGLCAYNPLDPYFHSLLGSACQRLGDYRDAIRHYQSAVQLFPGEIHTWTNLGEVLLLESRRLREAGENGSASTHFERANNAFQKALFLDPPGKSRSSLRARVLRALIADVQF